MPQRNFMVMAVVLVVFLASRVHGFILDTNLDPCQYESTAIYCYNQNLTSIPVFNLTRYANVCITLINLSSNKLTSIENDAFLQLRYLNCSYTIQLGKNNMSQINEYAFRGIEPHIDSLMLSSNSLRSLPEAVGSIINLKTLFLQRNPIMSLNPSVMAKIGNSLITFFVGMASFQQWPRELRFLNELYQLGLNDIPFQSWDSDAFHGLTHVGWLEITSSNLTKIPNAVCALSALYSIHIRNNYFLNESKSDVFEPCSPITGTPRLGIVTYTDNRVDYFPNIFTMFPSVNTVYMSHNDMRFMNANKFEDNFIVETLSLHSNQFRRIPSGFNIFRNLKQLDLGSNFIENIEDNDLIGLRSLTSIQLAYNPIQFIEKRAFQNNMQLNSVDLSHTFLTTVPAAVTILPALKTLGLEANNIECTCDLASLKTWNVYSMQINGLCYLTNEPIETFIKTYIDAGKR
ncbi:leucine-rich repeat protein soc-2-like [Dreissena polymorpha]|uniref:leucine-rich repeat protein soc-2-like n=1 Tax=Dreissena polymorpha TaxID=45954 RepID=UPI002264C480|nr:leucine-rich repeat protein soc-2-like [Dreissena polymorpha]